MTFSPQVEVDESSDEETISASSSIAHNKTTTGPRNGTAEPALVGSKQAKKTVEVEFDFEDDNALSIRGTPQSFVGKRLSVIQCPPSFSQFIRTSFRVFTWPLIENSRLWMRLHLVALHFVPTLFTFCAS